MLSIRNLYTVGETDDNPQYLWSCGDNSSEN